MGRLCISYQLDSSACSSTDGHWTIFTSHLCCLLRGKLRVGSILVRVCIFAVIAVSFFTVGSFKKHYFKTYC